MKTPRLNNLAPDVITYLYFKLLQETILTNTEVNYFEKTTSRIKHIMSVSR